MEKETKGVTFKNGVDLINIFVQKNATSDAELKKVFRIVDIDKSGCISRTVKRCH